MKYIIKNCPSCHKDFRLNCQGQAYVNKYQCVYGIFDCEDVTACLLKQIVNICNKAIEDYDKEKFYNDDIEFFLGADSIAHTILEKLEIEEIEE